MTAVSGLTINFGTGGNSLNYLGGGWARPEPQFTWAIGQESHLMLPAAPDGREFVLTMNVIPFVRPPALLAQRITVSVEQTTIGMVSITRPTRLAWRIPEGLLRQSERTLVTLSHPDAARPVDLSDSQDDRALAFSVSEARLWNLPIAMLAAHPVPQGVTLGVAAHPGFALYPGIDPREWVKRRTGLRLATLATCFESIGDNCEFGLVQRKCDAEPLGLLRFAGAIPADIVRGIEDAFEGIGEPDDITPDLEGEAGNREFMIRERKYGLVYHTFVYENERSPDLMRQQEATRLRFLRRKFAEDLQAGEKIFVFKSGTIMPEAEILPLFLALNRDRANTLLWVVPARADRPSGTVEVLMNGLLKGYIDRFAPAENAHDFSFEAWIRICVHAFLLHRMSRSAA